eukprot:CAMPEP_0198203606 /NCGR_PEP_ID=MMETSP1445-20131203/6910_1 /TAXON_ID=36898 /ORGANISM="Pyramimonas sp., Strain CCMP2087" /LENGTH=485 /DNA_ID=CAMNT_0043875065 /DNA_START=130 /DNA_END=1587 /DNA_ORIENTATION=+
MASAGVYCCHLATIGRISQGDRLKRLRAPLRALPRGLVSSSSSLSSQISRFNLLSSVHGSTYFQAKSPTRSNEGRRRGAVVVRANSEHDHGDKVVFVAGAAGRTGIRIVRELAASGFKVRAGVRSLTKSSEEIFNGDGAFNGEGKAPVVKVNNVELVLFDVEDAKSLPAAIGEATIVMCCIGAPEDKALDWTLPKRIDGTGTTNLVEAAKAAGVQHFVLQSSLGTGKFGWPASALNLFWNVLDHKRDAELALIASGMAFTIVRPGGMERPTDDYEKTHKITLHAADSIFGGQISRRQVARVMLEAACHPEVAAFKVVEAVAEENALEVPISQLLKNFKPVIQGAGTSNVVEHYERKYQYKQTWQAKWTQVMGFAGIAPEAVNGRLAMIGILGAAGAEFSGQGNVAAQLSGNWPITLGLSLAVVAVSLVPFFKGVTAADAKAGVFGPLAETANGRLAMLALACVLYTEVSTGGVFVDLVKEKIPFL